MLRAWVRTSIDEIDARDWNACRPGELETHSYLRAVEKSCLAGFRWFYVVVEEDGRLVGVCPGFQTEYALDTTLTGPAKSIASGLRKALPGMMVLRLACLGSPCTETVTLGIDPSLPLERRRDILKSILSAFEDFAAEAKCGLLGLKDVPEPDQALWTAVARPRGYRPIAGLPVAHLDIDFTSIDDYLARLSAGTRKDMRRKLRSRADLRIERRTSLDGVIGKVMALYAETRARAEMQFEDLTPAYFNGVLSGMPDAAFCNLYYAGDELLAANLLIAGDSVLLDKFFCMNAERGRDLNLYFLSWFENLRICLEMGLKRYQSGQAAYANKLRLGSKLTPVSMHFRHRNFVVNGALRIAAPFFAADTAQPSKVA